LKQNNERKTEKNIENNIDADNTENFLETHVNFGVVFHCHLKDVDRIKKEILEIGNRVVYQRVSTNKLWICEDTPNNNKNG